MEPESGDDTGSDDFPVGLRVLVVDDDNMTLTILKMMLRTCNHKIVCVTRATDALDILHETQGEFDLILTDIHMPIMSGFEFMDIAKKEFTIPFIIISANDNVDLISKAAESGACSYLVKPVTRNKVQCLWQYVFCKPPLNPLLRVETEGSVEEASPRRDQQIEHSSSVNARNSRRLEDKRVTSKRAYQEEDEESDDEDKAPRKKGRMVWTSSLHHKFVEAVNKIGLPKVVPKKILEVMNVEGLSRTNVASHLQKYRLHLKGNKDPNQSSGEHWVEYATNGSDIADCTPGLSQLSNQETLFSNSMAQARHDHSTRSMFNQKNTQPHLVSTRSDFNQVGLNTILPSFENTGFANQANTSSYRINYAGLQLCYKEGMVGVRQTGLNGGITSNFSASINQNGKNRLDTFQNPPIPDNRAMNVNQANQVWPSNIYVNQNSNLNTFQVTQQSLVVDQSHPQQQSVNLLHKWCGLVRNDPANDGI